MLLQEKIWINKFRFLFQTKLNHKPPPTPKELLGKESKRIKEFYTSSGEHCSDVIPSFELVNTRKGSDNELNAENISDGVSLRYFAYPDPVDAEEMLQG